MIPLRDDPVFWRYGLPARTQRGWMGFTLLMALHLVAVAWLIQEWRNRHGFVAGAYQIHDAAMAAGALVSGVVTLLIYHRLPSHDQLQEWGLTLLGRGEITRTVGLRAAIVYFSQTGVWMIAGAAMAAVEAADDGDLFVLCLIQGMVSPFVVLAVFAALLQFLPSRLPGPGVAMGFLAAVVGRGFAAHIVFGCPDTMFLWQGDSFWELLLLLFAVLLLLLATVDVIWQMRRFGQRLFAPVDAAVWHAENHSPGTLRLRQMYVHYRVAIYLMGAGLLTIPVGISQVREQPAGMPDFASMLLHGYIVAMALLPVIIGLRLPNPLPRWSNPKDILLAFPRHPVAPPAVCAVVSFVIWAIAYVGTEQLVYLAGWVGCGILALVLSWLAMIPRRGRWIVASVTVIAALATTVYGYHQIWFIVWRPIMGFEVFTFGAHLTVIASAIALWLGFPMLAHRAERSTVPP